MKHLKRHPEMLLEGNLENFKKFDDLDERDADAPPDFEQEIFIT